MTPVSFEALTLSPGTVRHGDTLIFPYPSGRSADDFETTGAYLVVGSVLAFAQRDEVFSLNYAADGVRLSWVGGPDVSTSELWTIRAPTTVSSDLRHNFSTSGRLRPRGNKMGLIGDSRLARSMDQAPSGNKTRVSQINAYAVPYWISVNSNGRYRVAEDCKFAVAGTTTTDVINTPLTSTTAPSGFGVGKTQLQAAKECSAPFIIMNSCINDPGAGITAAQSIANMTRIANEITSVNKILIIKGDTPRGNSAFTAQRWATASPTTGFPYHMQAIEWQMRVAPTLWPGRVFSVDCWSLLVDNASATAGDILTTVTGDGLHENDYGSYIQSLAIIKTLDTLGIPPSYPSVHRRGDVYDATNNPNGNILGDTGFLADVATAWSGTSSGITYAGVKPSTMQMGPGNTSTSTLTCTGSLVGGYYRIRLNGTTSATANQSLILYPFGFNIGTGSAPPGSVLRLFAEWQALANSTGWAGLSLSLQRQITAGPTYDIAQMGYTDAVNGSMDAITALGAMTGKTWNGDNTVTMAAGDVALVPFITIFLKSSATVDLTFDTRNWAIRNTA